MMILNDTDRFGVAVAAIKGGALVNARVAAYAHEKCALLQHMKVKEEEYIYKHGKGWVLYFVFMYPNLEGLNSRSGRFV
jgi:phosphoketolase